MQRTLENSCLVLLLSEFKRRCFTEFIELIDPDKLRLIFNNDEEKIFCALNLILRHYVGGRFLTISKKYYQQQYEKLKKFKTLTHEILISLTSSQTKQKLVKQNSKHKNTTSYFLFNLYKSHKFKKEIINETFKDFNLLETSVTDFESMPNLKGIGKKYARNIKMDIRSEDVEEAFAIDSRIKNILSAVGLRKRNLNNDYESIELLLLNITSNKNYLGSLDIKYPKRPKYLNHISGWELDRLLFGLSNQKNNILSIYFEKQR